MFQGIPEQAEVPPVARAPASGGQPANPPTQAQQPAAAPTSGPNANPLDLFPQVIHFEIESLLVAELLILYGWLLKSTLYLCQGLPNVGANPGAGTLDFLRNSQQV